MATEDKGAVVGPRRVLAARLLATTAVATAAALGLTAAGCGQAEGEGTPAPAQACVDGWNRDQGALAIGVHAYAGHGISRAHAERIEAPADAPNIRSPTTCLVVFAAEAGDGEYGSLGGVETRFGWSQLYELGYPPQALDALQESAAADANATVLPDGKLALD